MKNGMDKNTLAYENVDEWLRGAITAWLRERQPQARTWKDKASALDVSHSVLYEFLRGGKSLRLGTAAQLIAKIGGDVTESLPGQKKKDRLGSTLEEPVEVFMVTDNGTLVGKEKLTSKALARRTHNLVTVLSPGSFFVEDSREDLILFFRGDHETARLRLVLAQMSGDEEDAKLVYLQAGWEDRTRREVLVLPWVKSGVAQLVPKKDIRVLAVAVATYHQP